MISSTSTCSHSALVHIFQDPLCKNQSLIKRVVIVISHILTLCIPLIIYRIIHHYLIDSNANNDQTLSQLGQTALNFADARLLLHKSNDIGNGIVTGREEKWFANLIEKYLIARGEKKQPVDKVIAQLSYLFDHIYWPSWIYWLRDKHEVAWSDRDTELLGVTEDLFQIAFARSIHMLKDIDQFIIYHNKHSNTKWSSREEALVSKDAYLNVVLFDFVVLYTHIRCRLHVDSSSQTLKMTEDLSGADTSNPFYQQGTTENRIRILFNEFCHTFREYISLEQLRMLDENLISYVKPDYSKDTYAPPTCIIPSVAF